MDDLEHSMNLYGNDIDIEEAIEWAADSPELAVKYIEGQVVSLRSNRGHGDTELLQAEKFLAEVKRKTPGYSVTAKDKRRIMQMRSFQDPRQTRILFIPYPDELKEEST